jgi:hypothetical protein
MSEPEVDSQTGVNIITYVDSFLLYFSLLYSILLNIVTWYYTIYFNREEH